MKTAADPISAVNIQKGLSLDCKLTGSLCILFLAFAVMILIAVPKYSDIFLQSKIEIPLPARIVLPLFVTLAPIKWLIVTICIAISLTFGFKCLKFYKTDAHTRNTSQGWLRTCLLLLNIALFVVVALGWLSITVQIDTPEGLLGPW